MEDWNYPESPFLEHLDDLGCVVANAFIAGAAQDPSPRDAGSQTSPAVTGRGEGVHPDTLRLDWLEGQVREHLDDVLLEPCNLDSYGAEVGFGISVDGGRMDKANWCKTLREAIGKAMKKGDACRRVPATSPYDRFLSDMDRKQKGGDANAGAVAEARASTPSPSQS